MGWTVIVEHESGKPVKTLPYQFGFSGCDIMYDGEFKTLCYLDPYGDTTFNSLMFQDLIADLALLKKRIPAGGTQIDDVLALVLECQEQVHTYLKFYGD